MAKVSLLICHGCRKKFPREELIQRTKSERLCKCCMDNRTKESEDYKALIKYICDGFRINAPTGQQLKSIKKFKELGYSYREIQYTIYYIYCVEKKNVSGTGIGLVPFYYEKAMKHRELISNAKRTARKIVMEEVVVFTTQHNKKPKLEQTRLIDIDKLF